MSVIPISRLLIEMGRPPDAAAIRLEPEASPPCCGKCLGEEEIRAEIQTAHARGVAEGWERGRSERVQSEQLLADRLADEQRDHLTKLAQEAMNCIDTALNRFRADASKAVAQALLAYLKDRLEIETMEDLNREIIQIIEEHGASHIKIRGPQHWIDRLAELPAIARSNGKVNVQTSDTIDVTVNIDGTLLETTIGNWLAGLEKIS